MPAKMANDLIPFMLTGTISSWDVNTRVVYLGRTCLKFAPGVPIEVLTSHQSVTVAAHRRKHIDGPWGVTEIVSV